MRRLMIILAILLALAGATTIGAQFLPGVAKAMAVVSEYQNAVERRDGASAAAMIKGPYLDQIALARDRAFSIDEKELGGLPFPDRYLVLLLRANVLAGRLEATDIKTAQGRDILARLAVANARVPATSQLSLQPLGGLPFGSGSYRVWVGPVGYSPFATVPLSVFNGLYFEVSRSGNEWQIDPAKIISRSAAENEKYLAGSDGSIRPAMYPVLFAYDGPPERLLQPLPVSQ